MLRRLAGLLAGLLAGASLVPAPARAAACCTGNTSTVPMRLGECESWLAGMLVGGEAATGRWDGQGQLATSSLQDDALIATAFGAWAWDRKGQVGVLVPSRLNRKGLGEDAWWGGGLGDVSLLATWDPLEERARDTDHRGAPVPVFTAGLRLPTGRTWAESEGVLMEDVTGRPGPSGLLTVGVERTLGAWPWSVGADGELAPEDTVDGRRLQPSLGLSASVGRYLAPRWSLTARARHQRVLDADHGSSRTSAGLTLTRGQLLRWRGWVSGDADLPVPLLGSDNLRLLSVSAGAALVR
ncbi:MAG: hypothetical protein H6742_06435 [Alphaproteobacteria bacterium]|nr:hypothetical protein [Alphaproteobacteria bacterium]